MSATHEVKITADTSQAVAEIQGLRAEVEALRAELDATRSPRISVRSEPLTYDAKLIRDRNGPGGFRAIPKRDNNCYIRDLALMRSDSNARERMNRHRQEMRVIEEERQRLFHPEVSAEFEQRAVNWSAGTGGYFAPPLWVVEWFAMQPTPERVLSKMAPTFELPEGAQSVNVPAFTSGPDVGVQALNSAVASGSTVDAAASSAVVTIAGNYDVPLQMLEQSPQGAHLDWLAFTAMEARYGFQLELQMINGMGATVPQGSGNNQLLGIYNNGAIPAANIISFTGASVETAPTVPATASAGATTMFGFLGLAAAKVGQNRLLPPEAWLMSTSRSAWLGSSEDQQSRPLMITDNSTSPGVYDLLAYPVHPDDAIPRNSGAAGNEDRIIICRPSDWLVLESDRHTSVMLDALSGTLQARLQMRRYAAAILRRPESVAYLAGTGMATGGGF